MSTETLEELADELEEVSHDRRKGDEELKHRLDTMEAEIKELRSDIKELVSLFKTSKHIISFVKWFAGVITFIITAAYMLTNLGDHIGFHPFGGHPK